MSGGTISSVDLNKEKMIATKGEVPLMEQFYSVQGEGFYSGRPAVFIRLAGCDVGCFWCDVKESWNAADHPKVPFQQIFDFVHETKCNFVVITGGEPAMYDLTELTIGLKALGCEIAMETSGAYDVVGTIDWMCFSPKKFKQPVQSIYQQADELKVIIYNKHDFEWAQDHATKVNENCKLYIQAEWDKREEVSPLIIEFVKQHPEWNISVQTHKYLNIP